MNQYTIVARITDDVPADVGPVLVVHTVQPEENVLARLRTTIRDWLETPDGQQAMFDLDTNGFVEDFNWGDMSQYAEQIAVFADWIERIEVMEWNTLLVVDHDENFARKP